MPRVFRATSWLTGGAAALLGWALTLRASPAAGQTYSASQIANAADQSLDVMKDHVTFLATQDRYDASLGYFTLGFRGGPARLAANDGTTPRGVLLRTGSMAGFGYGPPSKFGLFAGAWVDFITAGTEHFGGSVGNGLLFVGAGFKGFQLTLGSLQRQALAGRDAFGAFKPTREDRGGPGTLYSEDPWLLQALTAYHTSGASLVVTRAKAPGTDSYRIHEVRAQLQPLKRWLAKEYGLPMVALQKLSDAQGYYGESPPDPARPVDAPSAELSGAAPERTSPYETELGSDDLLGLGIRVHAVTQVYPSPKFRRAEAGAYRDLGRFTLAARAHIYTRSASVQASMDSFVRLQLGKPRRGKVGVPFSAAVSYSYNSPDGATFLPLPYAHVFGLQLVLGVPEIAKSIVPIVRAAEEEVAP